MIRHRASSSPIVRPGFSRERAASLAVAAEETPLFPTTVDDLFFYLDSIEEYARTGVTETLTTWTDESAAGNDATNTGSACPKTRNAFAAIPTPYVLCEAGDYLSLPSITFSAIDYTYFCVFRCTASFSVECKLLDVQTGRTILYAQTSAGAQASGYYDGSTQVVGGSSLTWGLHTWRLKGASNEGKMWLNTTARPSAGTYTQRAFGGSYKLFAHYNTASGSFIGEVGCILGYSRALTDQEVADVQAWLIDRFEI